MQTLYYGGSIVTMERPLCAQALVTRGDRIAFVGDLDQARAVAGPGARQVDLQGRALLPAFLDAHSHLAGYASGLLQVPLEECADQQELCRRLADYVTDNSLAPGDWVRGKGYDHNTLVQGAPPDRWMLDRFCPDNPVVIQHASGHVGVFNSRALELLGVNRDTPCPDGGVMARDSRGELTGYMEENAFISLFGQVPMPEEKDLLEAFRTAQRRYAAHGITTVQEGMFAVQLIELYRALIRLDMLELDVVGYADLQNREQILSALPGHVKRYCGNFKLGGYKMFLDGSPQGRTAWMRTPYLGEADYRGYPTLTDSQVRGNVALALDEGMQLLAHCNGDAAAQQYLTCMEQVEREKGVKLRRPVMIHAQLLDLDQLEQVKRLGVIPSFFVAHVYHWGDVHVKNFGLERAGRISPAAAALKAGIPFTFHQDAPVIQPDMLETVWCAVNRRTRGGLTLGAEQRIPVLEALKAVTINAAYQYFEEGEKGSLQAGKRADLVILERDPLSEPVQTLREIPVLETVKAGRTIYRR